MKKEVSEHVDVKGACKKLWAKKWVFIAAWVVVIVGVGALTYLLPTKWKSNIKIVPEYNLQESVMMQEIFSDMDLDFEISAVGDAFSPMAYYYIVGDEAFLNELASKRVVDRQGVERSVESMYHPHKKRGELYAEMRKSINCKSSMKNSLVVITATAPEDTLAVQLVNHIYAQLEERVATYRKEKAEANLKYYAQTADQGELNARLYEMAKVRMNQELKPFVVVQQAEMPVVKAAPKRSWIVGVAWLIVTLILAGWFCRKDIVDWL